ncbi:hypothetical protein [Roseomonas sp. KE2513]|uniref:hypothetical protein n=1 Tax=Roseomonas sp. KE2513 TaxID=2479202 RepID=UPI0018DFA4FF|nr:hypothetical protein [Roseomonas sp. KE2513]
MTKIVADGEGPEDLGKLAETLLAELPVLFARLHPSVRIENLEGSAARWRDEGDIFAVEYEGVEYVPTFQFRAGRPHPTIRAVLSAFPPGLTAWDRAYWFVSADPGLGDRRPYEALDDAEALVVAARLAGARILERRRQAERSLSLHGQARA